MIKFLNFILALKCPWNRKFKNCFMYRDYQRSIYHRNFKCDTNVPPGHSFMKYLMPFCVSSSYFRFRPEVLKFQLMSHNSWSISFRTFIFDTYVPYDTFWGQEVYIYIFKVTLPVQSHDIRLGGISLQRLLDHRFPVSLYISKSILVSIPLLILR